MTDNGAKLTVTFTHPTNSEQNFRAAVTPESTADYLIQELVSANFMPPTAANQPYLLAFNGTEMRGSTTLQAAGVQDGAVLQVHRSASGASASTSASSGSCRA